MKLTISLRISPHLWMDDARRADVLALLGERRDTVDEAAFFTAYTHLPLPLDTLRERARALGEVMPVFKELGLSVGINHLATIGHLDENVERSLREPWQRLVDIDGRAAAGCYCVSDPRMREYVAACYAEFARARPDFIWIDDDVRMVSHPPAVKAGCFCDACLAGFSSETGTEWTRESLRAALADRDKGIEVRRRWLGHNRRYLAGIASLVRGAVDSVDPSIRLGYMSCDSAYDGYGFAEMAGALAGERGIRVKWRPGGGFYTDRTPAELLSKALSVGRQVAMLPRAVEDVQYEHENFPYQSLGKSMAVFVAETAAAVGAGCTGVALNVMGTSPDPIDEYAPFFRCTRDARALLERAAGTFGRTPAEGLWPALTRDCAAFSADFGGWGAPGPSTVELAEIGLPCTSSIDGASVTLLAGDAVRQFAREELLRILSGGVLLDGPALAILSELGLAEHVGFAIRGTRETDTVEVLTEDAINGRFAGWHRDCRPSFWPERAYLLEPLSAASRVVSEAVDFIPDRLGPVGGVFENALGGRAAVLGYTPWRMVRSLARSSQMRSLARWLSRDALPAYVSSHHAAAIWCRRDARGRPGAILVNASIDPAEGLSVSMCGAADGVEVTRTGGRVEVVGPRATDGPYAVIELPRLGPWEAALLSFPET